jgi:hypothetical protein
MNESHEKSLGICRGIFHLLCACFIVMSITGNALPDQPTFAFSVSVAADPVIQQTKQEIAADDLAGLTRLADQLYGNVKTAPSNMYDYMLINCFVNSMESANFGIRENVASRLIINQLSYETLKLGECVPLDVAISLLGHTIWYDGYYFDGHRSDPTALVAYAAPKSAIWRSVGDELHQYLVATANPPVPKRPFSACSIMKYPPMSPNDEAILNKQRQERDEFCRVDDTYHTLLELATQYDEEIQHSRLVTCSE